MALHYSAMFCASDLLAIVGLSCLNSYIASVKWSNDDDCRNRSNFVFVFGTNMRILKKYFIVFRFFSFSDESGCVLSGKCACGQFSVGLAVVDPSAAPPPLFRLARTKSKIRLAAAAAEFDATSWTEAHHIISEPKYMEHVVSTASVVTVGYFWAH